MRLEKLQAYLAGKGWPFSYTEEDSCGSVDFEYRGLVYHVWEFPGETPGAESNVRCPGRQEDYFDDYEDQIIALIDGWREEK